MNISEEDKKKIMAAAKKLPEDKKQIQDYSRGEITKDELEAKGIKLSMPLKP